MEQSFLKRMKGELEAQRDKILTHLARDSEGLRDIVEDLDPKDPIDLASDDVDKNNLEALNAVEFRTLQLIDNALARIQNNRYGVCMECAQRIPEPRLEALPYALFCVACQGQRDRMGR